MKKSFLIVAGALILTAIFVNTLITKPVFKNLREKADFEIQAKQPDMAETTLFQLINKDSFNIENHYEYITAHFAIPEKTKKGKYDFEYRDDDTIEEYYESLSLSPDRNMADIGWYGKGLIEVQLKNYDLALHAFLKVQDSSLKYLNNSIGNAFKQLDSNVIAEKYFKLEIANNGNLHGAYSNLSELLLERNELESLHRLLEKKQVKKFIPLEIERTLYFKSLQPLNYISTVFSTAFSSLNLWGFIAALLITASWVLYLRKIDIFDVEKWRHIVMNVLLGMLFSFLTFPLSDFINLILGFKLSGDLLNDFAYCVVGIGAVEELVKILPFLLIIRYTKLVNEPFDYILYASLSALGFAFVENLIYFKEHNLQIIHGRAMTAVVAHMFDSSIIAYGLMLNKYKRKKNPYLNFLYFFTIAALAHGFYDYWLVNESASAFSFFTILLLLVSMVVWNSFKNNALNQSSFYDPELLINEEKLHDYLLYSLAGILLFEYVVLAYKFSPEVANSGLMDSLTSGTYLLIFLAGSLSRFSLNKGEWAQIKYWGAEKKIDYDKILGTSLKIKRFTRNHYIYEYLPRTGNVERRITISEEPDWYMIKLDNVVNIPGFSSDRVLIRTKDKEEALLTGKNQFVAFYAIPDSADLCNDKFLRTDFKFCGWARIE